MGNCEVIITGISGKTGHVIFQERAMFVMEDNESAIIRRDEIARMARVFPDLVRVRIDIAI